MTEPFIRRSKKKLESEPSRVWPECWQNSSLLRPGQAGKVCGKRSLCDLQFPVRRNALRPFVTTGNVRVKRQ
jgi:hypothetical protein